MYAKARANRFKDSSSFGSQYQKPLNFKATSFILMNRQSNALTAKLVVYYNKSITLDRWKNNDLRNLMNQLNIRDDSYRNLNII